MSAYTLESLLVVLLVVVPGAIVCAAFLAHRSGVFSKLRAIERRFGPFLLLYVNGKGPYRDVSEHWKKLCRLIVDDARLVPAAEQDSMGTVGFYYDDPKSTRVAVCRCSVGYCAETHGSQDLDGYMANLKGLSVCKTGELQIGQFPSSPCLAVEMPLHGLLSMWVAVWRAYPLLKKEAVLRLGREEAEQLMAAGIMEVYRPRERTMWVVLPLIPRSSMLPF